ncbi:hypothetical protein HELRODRAFT_183138 [Helobdella robusta]|uniref:Uncharacterized protein n=1 Tax=Helobdella robusta TaxID=6412 RepID=T1FJ69_HELRO|nr:hypothetical protein HELRODRAFT_183138 [Helobdella robusta]ESO11446.1 hypothetical protein HELRODRAFT_183138 [Helobdella robusta]
MRFGRGQGSGRENEKIWERPPLDGILANMHRGCIPWQNQSADSIVRKLLDDGVGLLSSFDAGAVHPSYGNTDDHNEPELGIHVEPFNKILSFGLNFYPEDRCFSLEQTKDHLSDYIRVN